LVRFRLRLSSRSEPSARGSDPKTWKTYARNSSNETILKHSVTLLDNLEAIVVGSES